MKRILIALISALLGLLALPASPASATVGTTFVWSPHPDDETLRLSSFVLEARARGERVILVAVTDGGASSLTRTLGISSEELMELRRGEQDSAWAALAGADAAVVRLGLPDGAVSSAAVTAAFNYLHSPGSKHYIAASTHDHHADHRAVAKGVIDGAWSRRAVVRQSLAPDQPNRWNQVRIRTTSQAAAEVAHHAYDAVSGTAVRPLFEALHERLHESRIIPALFVRKVSARRGR